MNTMVEWMNAWGARFTGFALPMLAQSAVLIALCLVLDLALRNQVRATIRYAVWMLVLVKLVLPPSLALPTSVAYWFPGETVGSQSAMASAAAPTTVSINPQAGVGSAVQVVSQRGAAAPALTGQAMVFMVWLAVMLGLAIGVVWRWRLVFGVLKHSTAAPDAVRQLVESCRQQLGIKQAIPIRCAAAIGSPAICGGLRPVILIPPALADHLDESEMRSVLLHELAHFKRGDLWVNHAQIVLQLVYWYHPLLWLANAKIRQVREQAVDEMVLVEMRQEAEGYPATLLHVAKLGLERPMAAIGLMGILEPRRGLTQRIRHMVNRPLPRTARIGRRGLAAVLLLALVAVPMACRRTPEAAPQADRPVDTVVSQMKLPVKEARTMAETMSQNPATRGMTLTAQAAAALEAKLADNPEDLSARGDLLVYYMQKQFKSASAREARQKHILWLIEHHPEFSASGPPRLSLNRMLDGSAYEQGKALWLKQVEGHPQNPEILGHAAAYFLLFDRAIAEDLLKQAQTIEPQNPRWSEQLGQLYALETLSQPGTNSAAKALAELEKVQTQTSAPAPEFYKLKDLAKMAFAAGDIEKARTYATELLRQAQTRKKDWNYGNAIQHGNIVLGRIALRDGKMDEAKQYLREAGKTPGSPQLNSFGPNMTLAKDLLEKGETLVVLEYFKQCRIFWKMGGDKLDKWAALAKGGQMPDFGGNLAY